MSEHADRVMELSGCPPTYSHGPKILWWRSERPEDYRRIARFVVPGAYVAGRLCGLRIDEAFIDRTYIHFSNLSDTAHSRWASELLDAFNVDRRLLPRIVDPLDIIGEVTQEGEEATGIPVGVPVAAGAGDQTAAALGAGVVTPGQAFDSAGTASAFAICVDSFAPDVEGKAVLASHSVLPGVFISLAFINGGGLALRWFRDEVMTNLSGEKDAYEQLNELAADVEPGAGGLLWIPHIQGEVLPPRPYVRGGWVGMTSGHTRAHMFRAILEGIALQYGEWSQTVSESFGGEGLREARVLGGGARSRLWNSIKADVVGATWTPMLRQECGVLGDALIAAGATGHIKDLAAAVNGWQETGKGISPDPVRHARYQQLLLIYRQLVEQMQPVFKQLEVWDQEN
jgi:xylulokinase